MKTVEIGLESEVRPSATVERLDRLQAALDEVRRAIPSFCLEAIPWFHLKHPPHLLHSQLLAGEEPAWPGKGARLCAGFLCGFYALYWVLRLFQMRLQQRRILGRLRSQRWDLILKSWRFWPASSEKDRDFYWGDLAVQMTRAGLRVLTLYGNPNGRPWQGPGPRAGSSPELPEWCWVPLWAPLVCAGRAFQTARNLNRFSLRTKDPLVRAVARAACRDVLAPGILPVAMYAFLGRQVARRIRPAACLFLYEGNAWERCLSWGIRTAGPRTRLIGYQHTILLPHQRSLLACRSENAVRLQPDVVLHCGSRTLRQMSVSHPRSKGIAFGTFRRLPSGPSASIRPAPERRTVLVLPEGHPDETQVLFEMALALARLRPDHRFILRCHPVLPFERVRPHLARDPREFSNVTVSNALTIEADFLIASAVLYRGSSSVLFAIRYGLKPFYLDRSDLPEVDPLFELQDWRERADSPASLAGRLGIYALQSVEGSVPGWQVAEDYVRSYMVPVREESIQELLCQVRRAGDRP